MRRYIVLLLITGIVWAQTDFDKLVLKDGTTYLGEYSKIEEEIVYFKPQNAFDFIPISVKRIQRLELKFGQIVIAPGLKIEAKYQNKFINNKINTNKINCLLSCIFFIGFLSLMDISLFSL